MKIKVKQHFPVIEYTYALFKCLTIIEAGYRWNLVTEGVKIIVLTPSSCIDSFK